MFGAESADSLEPGATPQGWIMPTERALKARLNARLNRVFSAGLCIYGLPWGVSPGSYEHGAFGAKKTRAGTHELLSWWPGERTFAQQMNVQMRHTFTRIGSAINHHAVAAR